MEPVSVLLHDAQTNLRKHGWVQGALHNSQGYCSVGAIHGVSNWRYGYLQKVDAQRQLRETRLFRSPLSFFLTVEMWNDMPWRRKQTILARFRKAERRARRDEERNTLHVDPKLVLRVESARRANAERASHANSSRSATGNGSCEAPRTSANIEESVPVPEPVLVG